MLNELLEYVSEAAQDAELSARMRTQEFREYAAERTLHLAGILERGEPGYAAAVVVERDNLVLKAAIMLSDELDSTKVRLVGMLHVVLLAAARVIAGGAK